MIRLALLAAAMAFAATAHAEQRYSPAQTRLLCSLFLYDLSHVDPQDWHEVKSFDAVCRHILKHRRKGKS